MSAIVDAAETKPVSRRIRKRPQGEGARRRSRKPRDTEDRTDQPAAERKPRPESIPVPAEFVGKTMTGVVSAIIRKGRLRFGFIHIGAGPEIDEAAPRIYFSFSRLSDTNTTIRRGYVVSFLIAADEQGRAFADAIDLTEEGKVIAAEKEVEIARRRVENPREGEEAGAPRRERRERRPVEEKLVTLRVTCEGKADVKLITFNVAQTVGKVKNVATSEFDAPVEFNVFHVTAENPTGVFLTKALLSSLAENETIHLGAPREEVVAAAL